MVRTHGTNSLPWLMLQLPYAAASQCSLATFLPLAHTNMCPKRDGKLRAAGMAWHGMVLLRAVGHANCRARQKSMVLQLKSSLQACDMNLLHVSAITDLIASYTSSLTYSLLGMSSPPFSSSPSPSSSNAHSSACAIVMHSTYKRTLDV
jgi:hypothetical protein